MNFHCLFEQSGTFKNVFKEYGHNAWDYDILNDYGQTDYVIDLFKEIENEYENIANGTKYKTIFSDMQPDKDFIIAFFPCTYFSDMNEMIFKAVSVNGQNFKNNIPLKHIERLLKRNNDRAYFFELFIKLCFVLQELKLKTIIENPSSPIYRNYLELYSPYRPNWREKDRTLFGDYFRKPTNFFAINFELKESFIMYDEELNKKSIKSRKRVKKVVVETNQRKRSEITSRYVRNFYKRFLENKI